MNSLTYRKIVTGLTAVGVLIVILIPDVIIDLLLELLHFIWEMVVEIADLLFEALESTLDNIIELIFETDLHNTQIIVFYIILSLICFGLYRLMLLLPAFFQRIIDKWVATWTLYKIQSVVYWKNLSFVNKMKTISIGLLVVYLMFFL